MSAGFKYNLNPKETPEERYAVKTGDRRIGIYVLQKEGIPVGTILPSFMPIYADLKNKKAYMCLNAEVYEDAKKPTSIKVKKGTPVIVGMFLGNGTLGAQVSLVDTTNEDYDVITFADTLGADVKAGDVLFRTKAVDGLEQMYVANSALFGRKKVDDGITDVSLLRTAAEIEPDKLIVPFTDADKESMKGWFQFNE